MGMKLVIDLEKCRDCDPCKAACSYFYHPFNDGIQYLREVAEFKTTCRQCEAAPCVTACPADALERQEDGSLTRWNMRCVACNTCSYACPFGTILPELIEYAQSRCDYCVNRLAENEVPVCVGSCTEGAVSYREAEPDASANEFAIGEHLIVRSIPWKNEVKT